MNKSKFPLALIINILTAILIGYVCFLGLNFYKLGDKSSSILYSFIISLILILTSLGAALLKKTKQNFKICKILEITALVLFTIIMVFITYFPFSHYFNVTVNKGIIQDKLKSNIHHTESLYAKYEEHVNDRDTRYLKKIDNAVKYRAVNKTEFNCFEFDENGVSLSTQITAKHGVLKKILIPDDFKSLQKSDLDWLKKAKISVDNWEPISVIDVVNNIENNTVKTINFLDSISKKHAICEDEDLAFNYTKTSFPDINKNFTVIKTPSLFSISLALIGYLFMLFFWYITERDTKRPLPIADYEIVL